MKQRTRTVFRALNGLLLLDKPAGLSSNQALQQARHIFRASKGGHTGSLDPLATGLLPLCFGEATKIAGLLLGARKAYETTAMLGVTTDTDDADGLPLRERSVPVLSADAVEAALAPLRGPILQRAPIYSALKQGGEPLYAKARRGEAIQAPERNVLVHALEVRGHEGNHLRLHVECGSGTYVRSLVRDMGERLGCGAHVSTLRRLWVDPFRSPRMFSLDELRELAAAGDAALDACLLPIEAGLVAFPQLALEPEGARRLGMGQPQPIEVDSPPPASEAVVVTDMQGRALGIATVGEDGMLRPQRLFTWASAPQT
ncbi:MAG: tRNA pseudouridine(55) synthase TruB [Pseudomonadota bacterium]|nr:tRNA pseudouridine(55) synthase TruB [Pseudomonadota bacterium]